MSAHKHTPGPWKVLNARKEDWLGRPLEYWTVTADDGDEWLCASPEWDPEHEAESEANARLISAAPDSHEANVMCVEAMDRFFGIESYWNDDLIYAELPSSELAAAYFAARAAIAKATGETA